MRLRKPGASSLRLRRSGGLLSSLRGGLGDRRFALQTKKWQIEQTDKGVDRAYLTTGWTSDDQNGGDYGSVGISLGKGNKPLNENSREVAISIRVVSETKSTTRVKVSCLFRIQTSQGLSGTAQTMFGTSKGIVEDQILTTIRSRLVLSQP